MGAVNQSVIDFAKKNVKKQVGKNGTCWDLAEEALKASGAQTSKDFGKVTASANYKWGTPVVLSQVQPGDIIQFKDHKVIIVTTKVTKLPDGRVITEKRTEVHKRGHHTAIAASSAVDGMVTVFEQHVNGTTVVTPNNVNFENRTTVKTDDNVTTTTKITVIGHFWFYRPVGVLAKHF